MVSEDHRGPAEQGLQGPDARSSIAITNDYRGVAATGGNHVVCNAAWFKRNYNGEGLGAVVHELVHVVQRYGGRARGGTRNPGWLVEGIADYIRWFKYEPKPTGTRPRNPDQANYTDSYRITAGFLNFVVEKHEKELVKKLNAAMRQGSYSPDRGRSTPARPWTSCGKSTWLRCGRCVPLSTLNSDSSRRMDQTA